MDWDDPFDAAENAEIPADDPRRSLSCWYVCRHCDAWIDCEDVWAMEEGADQEDLDFTGDGDFDDEDETAEDLEERLDNALRRADRDETQKGGG